MAGGIQSSRKGRGGRRKRQQLSEINVTPFVDVMLVLLVIFMIAAPLMTVGVPIDLPRSQAKQLNTPSEPLTISINKQGEVFLQEEKMGLDDLTNKLLAISQLPEEERIYIRGDEGINYGLIMQVMGKLNSAGFRRIALVANPEQS